MTREEWLMKVTEKLRKDFSLLGFPVPKKVRVSCGWPLGKALKNPSGKRNIGQCFEPAWSKDKHTEIFISPCLEKSIDVAGVLVHELVHAAVGAKHGHRAPFKRLAKEIGLKGPMRATVPSAILKERLNGIIKSIGRYPHSILDGSKRKKQGTRLIKLECESCGYVIRTTMKWIVMGIPTCCCGTEFS